MPTNFGGDIVDLDALAVRESARLVACATEADLELPTPCADWTLHGLLRHMIAQHYGFAAAAAGDGELARWRPRPLGQDPIGDYNPAADVVLAAFAAEGVLAREFPLPEIARGLMFPAAQAISFHFVDYVAHSWDVAMTLGLAVRCEPAVLDAAMRVARAVPGGKTRLEPGAAFAPAVAYSNGSPLDKIVALLGRSPDWRSARLERLQRLRG
jgi:uncharacterized protein (TIGR03086 family)